MKTLTTGVVCLGIGIGVGLIISANLHETNSLPPLTVEPAAHAARQAASTEPKTMVAPNLEPAHPASAKTSGPEAAAVAVMPSPEPESPKATALRSAIERLASPQTTFQERQAVLKQLRESGQVDQAIDAVKQGAAENPNSAAYPLAMGELEMQKAAILARTGGTVSQMGIAGMSADQAFDDVLKVDPSNWEAQFYKAAGMYYWPPELNKGSEIVQRLQSLIDQQEAMPQQPQFAQTYVLLGNQYQKAGQPDYALQTWQLGAQKFPADQTLQGKIAGARNP